MKCFFTIVFLMFLSCNNQKRNNNVSSKQVTQPPFNVKTACGYTNEILGQVYTFSAGKDAELAVKEILAQTGLPQNFKIAAADVDNAAAVIQNENHQQVRYILYNREFFKTVEEKTKSRYSALSILAHEIGHHLSGHTINNDGSRPLLELEADRFSGFIIRKLGASLNEAQSAIKAFCSIEGSNTHPPQKARLSAVRNGWNDADQSIGKPNITENQAVEKYNLFTHQISIAPKWALAFRSRILTANELKILNNPNNPEKVNIDANTLIAALLPGTDVSLINDSNPSFYKIKVMVTGEMKSGYIVKRVYHQNTIVPILMSIKK